MIIWLRKSFSSKENQLLHFSVTPGAMGEKWKKKHVFFFDFAPPARPFNHHPGQEIITIPLGPSWGWPRPPGLCAAQKGPRLAKAPVSPRDEAKIMRNANSDLCLFAALRKAHAFPANLALPIGVGAAKGGD